MSYFKYASGAVMIAAAFAGVEAHAQQANQQGAVALPTVNVEGEPENNGSLTVPSVAGQRRQLDETVGSVDFVDAAAPEIQTRHVDNLVDALKDVPGVFAQERYGQEVRVSIRGSGLTRFFHLRGIELLQDGIPVNLADGSGDFDQIDTNYFRSIEVYKGGNALMFGASTLGGAINFVSPTAYTAIAPDLIRIDGGSFGAIRGQAQVSRVIGDWDFLINGTFAGSNGYRDHSNNSYQLANGNVGYRFAPGGETRFYFGVYNAEQKIPGQLTFSQALNNPTAASLFASSSGFAGNQARDISDQRIANKTTFLTDWGRFDLNSWFINNTLYHPIYLVLDQKGYTAGFEPKFTATTNLGGFRDDVIVGARAWGGRQIDKRFINYNGVEVAPQVLDARQDALNLEIFGENRFFVAQNVALMTGLKLFSDSRNFTSLQIPISPVFQYDQRDYKGALPKAGVIWYPNPDIQVFADVTGSRDVPDFTDLTQSFGDTTKFVPLAAQRAWTGEIGTRGKWDRFSWDVTAYHADLHDELLQYTVGGSLGIPANTFNAGHTIHQGIEFSASAVLLADISGSGAGDALTLTQIWTLNNFFFDNDPQFGNNQLAGAPPNVLRTVLAYRRPDGLYIAPSLDWAPVGAYADYANTVRTPGYALLGVQAGVTLPNVALPMGIAPVVSFYLDARNLTNQRYISDVQTVINASVPGNQQIYFPGNGRAIYGGMKVTF